MKKKILAIVLCIAMLAVAIVGGTLAYFTDEDAQLNVMTTGKVDIEQLEEQRNANGGLEPFVQDKPLMPAVYADGVTDSNFIQDGYLNPGVKNAVDKIITVKNSADAGAINQDAYVRTILAFETNVEYEENTTNVLRDGKEIFDTYIGTVGSFKLLNRAPITIDGVQYVLAVKLYENPLVPGEVSEPSLKQIYMAPEANNEVAILFGSDYTIIALSQGTQTAGFDSAEQALNAAFGDLETIEEAKLVEWLRAAQKN